MVVKYRLTACSTVNDPRAGLKFKWSRFSKNVYLLRIVLTVQEKRLHPGGIGHTGNSIQSMGQKVDQARNTYIIDVVEPPVRL